MARLGEICTVVSGTTPKSAQPEYWDGDLNWVTPAELTDEFDVIYESQRKITQQAVIDSSLKPFPAGTVLLSSRAPIGKVAIAGTEMYCNQGFKNLICSEEIYNRYLYHFLKSKTTYLNSLGRGATFKEISKGIVENIEIPLPPLGEQRKIAAVLDKVSNLIAKRRRQLDTLDEMVKSRFIEMFGDPIENPKKWNLLSFREAGVRLSDGPFGSNLKSEHYMTEGVRVIRLGNIGVGQFIDNDKSYISEQHYEKLRKYTCRSGEIVIGTLGDPNLRACLVPKTIEYAINKADCVHYIPKPEILNTRFVCQYINCPETLLLASRMVHGQTRSRISSGQLAEFIEMFSSMPDDERVMMSEICKIITDGTHQPPKFVPIGIPFLFVSNIVANEIHYDAEKFISEETYNELIKRTPIEIGDILLSTVGSYGHPAIVKSGKPFCFQRHIAYLKPNAILVNSEYLRGAILSEDVQRQIDERVKGIAQKTLNLSEIRKLRLPLPPIEQQDQFAAFVAQTDKSKYHQEKCIGFYQCLERNIKQEWL